MFIGVPIFMVQSGLISLKRKWQYGYGARAFRVYIDEREVGKIGAGKTEQYTVSSGTHSVQIKIDYYKSNTLQVDLLEGQTLELNCGVQGLQGLSMKLFNPNDYLYIEYENVVIKDTQSKLNLRGAVETRRSEEFIGDEDRIIDNSQSSIAISRCFSVGKEWTKSYVIEHEQADVDLHEINIGIDSSSLKKLSEQRIIKKYSITEEMRELHQEQVKVEVPARTKIRIRFHWKRLWQHGLLNFEDEHGRAIKIPYKVITGVTFDQTQSDEI